MNAPEDFSLVTLYSLMGNQNNPNKIGQYRTAVRALIRANELEERAETEPRLVPRQKLSIRAKEARQNAYNNYRLIKEARRV
jgi:hypothetical protein